MPLLIFANANWNSTQFRLKKTARDKTLEITVSNKPDSRWTANPNFNGGVKYDARGAGIMPGQGGYKLQNAHEGVLVGHINGSNYYFSFDEAGKVKASGNTIVFRDIIPGFIEGELLLGINDNNVGDNQGHIEVIRIK